VSSDYYFSSLPPWVDKFNTKHLPDASFGKIWDRTLEPEAYKLTQAVTTDVKGSPLGRHFPYTVNGGEDKPGEEYYKAFQYTPFASEYLADFAKAAIEGESLGSDSYPDLLAISFSTPDLVGHSYGPDSEEVEDIYIRLDKVIEDLLNYLDQHVGLSNTLIAVTGDHGVTSIPALLNLNKIDAKVIDPNRCIDTVNKALTDRFGGEKWVLAIVNDQVFIDRNIVATAKADHAEVERTAAAALLTVPGIANAFTRTQILNGQMPPGPISQRIVNGFNTQRSGDVWLITNPFSFLNEGELSTTHGSPYDYDTHVPIMLYGRGIRADRYYQDCAPADIAPTICAALGVEHPSNRTGRVLVEALSTK